MMHEVINDILHALYKANTLIPLIKPNYRGIVHNKQLHVYIAFFLLA